MPITTQEIIDALGGESPAGIPADSVWISFRGQGRKYIPKYALSSLYTGVEGVDYSKNEVTEFDQDYSIAGATIITLDMSENPATIIKNSTNNFTSLTLMKELYIRELLCPNLNAIAPALVTFAALEKIDSTDGALQTMFDPSTSMSALSKLLLKGNQLPNTEVQTLLQRMVTLLGTTNVMNGELDLRGSSAFPQSPSWLCNYGGFTGTFSPGDLIDIRDAGNVVIAKGTVLQFGGGQIKWYISSWLSDTVPGTMVGANNIVNNSQAGTATVGGGISNDNGYLGTLRGTYAWSVLIDVDTI